MGALGGYGHGVLAGRTTLATHYGQIWPNAEAFFGQQKRARLPGPAAFLGHLVIQKFRNFFHDFDDSGDGEDPRGDKHGSLL